MDTSQAKNVLSTLCEYGAAEMGKATLAAGLWTVDPRYRHRFRARTWGHHLTNRLRYVAPPDPYRTITIRPQTITDKLKRPAAEPHNEQRGICARPLGQIEGGEWDRARHRQSLADNPIIGPLERRFSGNLPWAETGYRELIDEWFGDDYGRFGYQSFDALFADRCARYDALHQDIKENGYTPETQGPHLAPVHHEQPVRSQLEVLVAVDRTGEILFVDGHHRFAIARALKRTIPVHVVWRHEQWQHHRDRLHGELEAPPDHPDLQDLWEAAVASRT